MINIIPGSPKGDPLSRKVRMKRMVSGNQALAYGALAAGVDVAAGYPGTPSTEVLTEIMRFARESGTGPWVEWSVNEKVAFDIATGAAWSGKRALATMKMSGLNVSLDSVVSVAYSGTTGGFVLYVADDPGAEAGCPSRTHGSSPPSPDCPCLSRARSARPSTSREMLSPCRS
jgi:indolepyruvate ferredoxin oxidoreductase alpha subunit